jgi:hypothetical protein
VIGEERRAEPIGLANEGVEHVARAVGVGKQLSVVLFVEGDAQLAKEGDGVGDGKGSEDAPDNRRSATPEISLADGGVGDVAARAAADQNLGAGTFGSLEQRDRARRVGAPRENRRSEPGGSGADDEDIGVYARLSGSGEVFDLRRWHDLALQCNALEVRDEALHERFERLIGGDAWPLPHRKFRDLVRLVAIGEENEAVE